MTPTPAPSSPAPHHRVLSAGCVAAAMLLLLLAAAVAAAVARPY